MSSQNIECIHRIYEAFQARDFPKFFSALSPEIRISQWPEQPSGGIFHGHEGAKRLFRIVAAHMDSYVSIERIMDDGADRMAVIGRTYGATKHTGRRFDVPILHLWRFRDRLAVRLEIALDLPMVEAALAGAA